MSWEDAVDAALGWLRMPPAPMRRLLLAAGPTPRRGPLTHDLLVPGARAGVNVFGHGRELGLTAALLDVSPGAAEILAYPGVTWAGGLAVGADGGRVKLYAVDGWRGLPAGAIALGVDVIDGEPCRWRTYHPPEAVDLRAWPQLRWPEAGPGESHRLVTVLADEKRTLNILFRPDATLAQLARLAPVARFAALASKIQAEGYVLRPAAWELDAYPDGRTEVDVLLTIGEP